MTTTLPAAREWAAALAGWGVPDDILRGAPQPPWIVPPALFRVPEQQPLPDSPSHRLARAVLPVGGTVLDVGCGGGRAALAVAPPAGTVIGVDEKAALLREFAAAAEHRALAHREIEGRWPDVEAEAPVADVVVCHHVAYNVSDLGAFALALSAHARRRVVMELSWHHPLHHLSPLWERFWGLVRPSGPTALDAAAVLREAGLPVRAQEWPDPSRDRDSRLSPSEHVEITRIRLCLPAERDEDVAAALAELEPRPSRRTAALWWDVAR